jgi:hypothetical protein
VGWETWRAQVRGDSIAPRLVSAAGFAYEGVTVQLSEPVDPATAELVSNWSFSPVQAIVAARVQPGGRRVFLSTPGMPAGSYTLSVHSIGDTLQATNVMTATVQCTLSVVDRAGWISTDIGHPFIGGATLRSTPDELTLVASSLGTNNSYDQMRFAWQRCRGDFAITTRVAAITNHGSSRCGGLMARESDDPSSRMVGTWWPWNAPIITARRTYAAAPTDFGWGSQVPTATPYWMRFTRTGNTFVYAISPDGATWSTTGTTTLALSDTVLVGLTASAGNCSVDTVTFDNISITGQDPVAITRGMRPERASASPLLPRTVMYTLNGKLAPREPAGRVSQGCYLLRANNGAVSYYLQGVRP